MISFRKNEKWGSLTKAFPLDYKKIDEYISLLANLLESKHENADIIDIKINFDEEAVIITLLFALT